MKMDKLMLGKESSNLRSLSINNKQANNDKLAFKNIFDDKRNESNNKLEKKDPVKKSEKLDKKQLVDPKKDEISEEESLEVSKKPINDEVLALLASLFLDLGELENPEEGVELLEEIQLVLELEGLEPSDDEIIGFIESLDLENFQELDVKEVFIKDQIRSKFSEEISSFSEEELEVDKSELKTDKNLLAMDRLKEPVRLDSEESDDELELDDSKLEEINQLNEAGESKELRSRKDQGNSADLNKEDMPEESSFDLDLNNLGQALDFELNINKDKNPILEDINNLANPDFQEIDEEDLLGQIINKMDFNLEENKNEVRINLKPENLGKMLMNLELSKGEVVAKIVVDNHRTKEVLENNIMVLQEELEETGVEIKSFEVFVGNNSDFDRHQGENQHFFNQTKKFKSRPSKNLLNRISADYESATIEEENGIISVADGRMDLLA